MHITPAKVEPKKGITGHSIQKTEPLPTDTPDNNINLIGILRKVKNRLVIALFIISAILITSTILLFEGKTFLPPINQVAKAIKPTEEKPAVISLDQKLHDLPNQYAHTTNNRPIAEAVSKPESEESKDNQIIPSLAFDKKGNGQGGTSCSDFIIRWKS